MDLMSTMRKSGVEGMGMTLHASRDRAYRPFPSEDCYLERNRWGNIFWEFQTVPRELGGTEIAREQFVTGGKGGANGGGGGVEEEEGRDGEEDNEEK